MATKISLLRKNSIQLSISFTILLVFASSVTAFYSYKKGVESQHKKNDMLKTQEAIKGVWSAVTGSDAGFRGYALIQQESFLGPYKSALGHYKNSLDTLAHRLRSQGYPNEKLIADNDKAIRGYISVVTNMIELVRQGRKEEALRIFEGNPGRDVWIVYNKLRNDAMNYVTQKQANAEERYQTAQFYTTIIQSALLLIGVPILISTIVKLRRNDRVRQQLLAQLDDSNREFVYNDGQVQTLDSQEATNITRRLTQNLEKVVNFIRNLGEEESEWTELSDKQKELNENTLVGELLKMQKKLDLIKQEDNLRLWATEGEGKVAEITRTHQTDLTALGDQLLAYIVKYVEGNQGGLFIVNDADASDQHLEMVACYAYDKKKYEERIIKPGQGLIGQAFIEKKIVRLKHIPEGYVRITSGLGVTTPSYLVIVPLKFNEQVLGVLEIAAFHELSDFKIDFLEQVGEIIASSISVVRTSQHTKLLLEESKQQAEEMKAQEEEMRQNMEELQATQEQQQRLQQELQDNEKLLQGKLAELEAANTNSEQIRQEERQRASEQIESRNKMMEKAMQKFKQREQELLAEIEEAKK